MNTCPRCGAENLRQARYCIQCGARLVTPRAVPEERKFVTTLFCDLVAFTAMSEVADPEDIDSILRAYHAVVSKVIESHGGSLEKFIGDAVVGVFGVPAVHEDDPERAVRAGLRIVEELEGQVRPDGLPLQVHIGINTGETLVRLDVDPGSGRGLLAGDAVNTAARLQSVAGPGCVVVGQLTHHLTDRIIRYEELAPAVAKGKSRPIPCWRALAPIARRGLDSRAKEFTSFVGRDAELACLSAAFDEVSDQAKPRFVLLVGEPGIGKSRLVRELLRYVDSSPSMTTWRQGYCPPFGEDVTYWALSEIVKGHAGIRDTDAPSVAEAKLAEAVPDGPDSHWVLQRLRALVGFATHDASREENFMAWTRFVEGIASVRPAILVVEDLHWADEALLAFLEHLSAHLASVPLLLVGTARPELFKRWNGEALGPFDRLDLGPLSPDEMEDLVAQLVGEFGSKSAAVSRMVDRCNGNPFYAEESARLLADAALGVKLPDSVQAVIAARLDALPSEQKELLSDAAVIGGAFWDGAMAAMGGRDRRSLDDMLSELLERQMIRPIRETSMEGEREYAFVHALTREVAYAQLTRAAKARKHAAAGSWIEAKVGEQPGDLVDVLAHHYATAMESAKAAGQAQLAEELIDPALTCLLASGKRALRFDARPAEGYFRKALDAAPADHPLRPVILTGLAQSSSLAMQFDEAAALLKEAIPGLVSSGNLRAHMRALMDLNTIETYYGRQAPTPVEEIVAALEADGPSEELVDALTALAAQRIMRFGDDLPDWTDLCERAIAVAREIDVPAVWARSYLADRHLENGDLTGLAEFKDAIEEAQTLGLGDATPLLLFNYGCAVLAVEGPRSQFEEFLRGLEFVERLGSTWYVEAFRMGVAEAQAELGLWDEASAAFAEVAARLEAGNDLVDLFEVRCKQVLLFARRGELAAALQAQDWIDSVNAAQLPAFLQTHALLGAALVRLLAEDPAGAAVALRQWRDRPALAREPACAALVPEGVRVALACGEVEPIETIAASLVPGLPLHRHVLTTREAAAAASRGEHREAVKAYSAAALAWHDFRSPYEEAQALLGEGRSLVELGAGSEAVRPLSATRAILMRLGAKPSLAEADELLKVASSA